MAGLYYPTDSGGLSGGYIPPYDTSQTSGYTGGTGSGLIPLSTTDGLQYQTEGSIPTSPISSTSNTGTRDLATGNLYTQAAPAAPAYDPNDVAYLDQQKSLYERLLQSLGTTLSSGLTNLDQNKIKAEGDANLDNDRAVRDYGTQREYSRTDKTNALGGIGDNARTLSDSLRRLFGLSGAANSSSAQVGNNAVARQASQQRSGVMDSFGRNERGLDTAEGDTKIDFKRIMDGIAQRRKDDEESLRAGVLTNEQGITDSLSGIASERASLLGGNPLDASASYRNRYLGIQDQLDALPNQFAPNYQAGSLKVTQPKLSDYLVDRAAINANRGNTSEGQATYSPYSQFLKNKDEQLA